MRRCTTFGIVHFVPFEAKISQNTWEISVNTCLSTQMRSSSEHKKSEWAKSTQKVLWVKKQLLIYICTLSSMNIHYTSVCVCECSIYTVTSVRHCSTNCWSMKTWRLLESTRAAGSRKSSLHASACFKPPKNSVGHVEAQFMEIADPTSFTSHDHSAKWQDPCQLLSSFPWWPWQQSCCPFHSEYLSPICWDRGT